MSEKETVPVREAHRFDTLALERWLAGRIVLRAPLTVEQMRGGQSNPTFLLRDAAGADWVLRKQPPGALLPSAHAVDREYRVLAALHPAGVPVPKPVVFCEDRTVIGTPFYLMERMRGRVFRTNDLPGMTKTERSAIYDAMNETLANLHAVEPASIGLADFGKAGGYYARQISRWTQQWQASKQRDIPALEKLVAWFPSNLAADDEVRIAHGDFRLDNLMFAADSPRVIAILDWELATIGPPLADLAYNTIPWQMSEAAMSGLRGLDLAPLGIPSFGEYVARYRERSGRESGVTPFHLAFAMFRLAVILEGVLARARSGNASSASAEAMGALGQRFAERAWEIVEGGL